MFRTTKPTDTNVFHIIKFLFVLIFFIPNLANALPNCKITKPYLSATLDEFLKVEGCSIFQIFETNKFEENDFRDFLTRAATLYPKSEMILRVEEQFQSEGERLIVLNFTKSLDNYELSLALSEIHFNRPIRLSELETAYNSITEIIGSGQSNKIFMDLLESSSSDVQINVAEAVSYLPSEHYADLKAKAKTSLNRMSESGNKDALEILLFGGYVEEDNAQRFYDLIRLHDLKDLDPFFLAYALPEFRSVAYEKIDSEWFRKAFLLAASENRGMHALARLMHKITGNNNFNLEFNGELYSQDKDFEKCSVNPTRDIFSCFEFFNKDDPIRFVNFVASAELLFEHFQITYQPSISNVLITSFFSADFPIDLKSEFANYFFLSVSLTSPHMSDLSRHSMRLIKSDLNKFMWSNYANDLVMGSDHYSFPLVDELMRQDYESYFNAKDAKLINTRSNVNFAIPVIENAKSIDFFDDLNLAIYTLYLTWFPDKIEQLIDQSLLRVSAIFGDRSEVYFDFAFHKSLIITKTKTINPVNFILKNMSKMKKEGLDASNWESGLIDTYIGLGEFEIAEDFLQKQIEKFNLLESNLKNASVDEKNVSPLTVTFQQCRAFNNLRKVRQFSEIGSPDFSKEIEYCFNGFKYPNKVPMIAVYEIFLDYMDQFSIFENRIAPKEKEKLVSYINGVLADNSHNNYFKIPFAFSLFILTDEIKIRHQLRHDYLNIAAIANTPEIVKSDAASVIDFLNKITAAMIIDDKETVAKELLSITLEHNPPDLFASLSTLQKEDIINISASDFLEITELLYGNDEQLQKLYVLHQSMKFGAGDQLILRNAVLPESQRKELQKLNLEKDLTVDRLIQEALKNQNTTNTERMLFEINNKLQNFNQKKISWEEIYPEISVLRQQLGSNSLYLDYRHDKRTNSIFLIALKEGDVSFEVIKNASTLSRHTRLFRQKLKSGDLSFYEEGEELFQVLVKPFLTDKTERILLSPHSFLFDIPFEALVLTRNGHTQSSQTAGAKSRGIKIAKNNFNVSGVNEYLGELYEVSLVSTIVKNRRVSDDKAYTFFGIGNPNFSGNIQNQDLAFNNFQNAPNRSGESLTKLVRLPKTEEELKDFSSLDIFVDSIVLTGDKATKESLIGNPFLEKASVISFATHGMASGEIDDYSKPGLALSPSNNVPKDDGFFDLTDVLDLSLTAELTILSACNTSARMARHSPPLSGLATAFLVAGSQKVMATLWPVDSEATKLFVTMVGKQKTKSNSWSKAKMLAIKQFKKSFPQYSHPNFWAPFIIFEALE